MDLEEIFKQIRNNFDAKQRELESVHNALLDTKDELQSTKKELEIIKSEYFQQKKFWSDVRKTFDKISKK